MDYVGYKIIKGYKGLKDVTTYDYILHNFFGNRYELLVPITIKDDSIECWFVTDGTTRISLKHCEALVDKYNVNQKVMKVIDMSSMSSEYYDSFIVVRGLRENPHAGYPTFLDFGTTVYFPYVDSESKWQVSSAQVYSIEETFFTAIQVNGISASFTASTYNQAWFTDKEECVQHFNENETVNGFAAFDLAWNSIHTLIYSHRNEILKSMPAAAFDDDEVLKNAIATAIKMIVEKQ